MEYEFDRIELNDQLKELLSAILERGELFFERPLQGPEIYALKQRGILIETVLPSVFRYELSTDARQYLSMNREFLKVDYSWLTEVRMDSEII